MNRTLQEVTQYLHDHIPLTQHLGAEVVGYDDSLLRIKAPLAPNVNHRETVFGGSISSLGILAGWTFLYLKLTELGLTFRLVIQNSSTDFLLPIEGDFEVVCLCPEKEEWDQFTQALGRKGKGRAKIHTEIRFDGRIAATQDGIYVAVALQDHRTSQ
jgi:thioesterase domain-containing protein